MTNSQQNAVVTPTPGAAPSPSSDLQPGSNPANTAPPGANYTAPAPEATPRGLKGSGLRYTEADGVPSWAIGKTADEILRLSQDMYGALQRGTVAAPAPAQHVAPAATPSGINPNLIYSDADAYTQAVLAEAERRATERLRAEAPAFVTPLASMARMHAQNHRPDVWKHYGPDIESAMASLPETAKGDISTWHRVVDFVAGQHVDEIASRKAAEIVARGSDPGMIPSGGAAPNFAGGSAASPIRRLFSENHPAIALHKEAGLSAQQVIDHGLKMGHEEAKYADMLTRKAAAVR
jgi:hypothetical protein